MKSYFEYTKEQREEKQKKIDSMKSSERLDYLNRYDRLKERFSGMWMIMIASYLLLFSLLFAMFSVLLFSIETNNSIIMFFFALEVSIRLFFVALVFTYLAIFEVIIRKYSLRKNINELDEKYNL